MPLLSYLAFPDIDPIAVQIGPIAIRWYALAYITGLLLGWRLMLRLIRLPGAPMTRADTDDFVVWAITAVILGGRLGYVLFYNPAYYAAHPVEILFVWRGGMSFHGGLLGVIGAVVLFSRRRGLALLPVADIVAVAAPIGLFFGRIANFVNAELYGRITELPWGMVFPTGGPVPAIPASSTRRRWRAWFCSSWWRGSTGSRQCGRGRVWSPAPSSPATAFSVWAWSWCASPTPTSACSAWARPWASG